MANRAGSASRSPAVFTATRPGTGRRAKPPVSRFSRTHRSIVGTDTSNRTATSSRRSPRSTAPITRSLRSSEYAFILQLDNTIKFYATRSSMVAGAYVSSPLG